MSVVLFPKAFSISDLQPSSKLYSHHRSASCVFSALFSSFKNRASASPPSFAAARATFWASCASTLLILACSGLDTIHFSLQQLQCRGRFIALCGSLLKLAYTMLGVAFVRPGVLCWAHRASARRASFAEAALLPPGLLLQWLLLSPWP